MNVIYLITWKNFLEQDVGSATNFNNCFRIHKSDIRTSKVNVGLQSILMVSVKRIAIFLFILLSKFMVMPKRH